MPDINYSRPRIGIGGTVPVGPTPEDAFAAATMPQERLSLADQMSSQAQPQMPQEPPEWLRKYMEVQPKTDPYHNPPVDPIDNIVRNKYLSEQEKLRYIKFMRDKRRELGR